MKTVFLLMAIATGCPTTRAQTVIEIPFVQYAPLTVVADEVNISLSGDGIVVGSGVSIEGGDGIYTYSWTDSDGTVLATTPTFKMTQAGRYCLVVTDGHDCRVSTLFTATGTTGIVLDEGLGMRDDGLKQVRVFDVSGRLLATYKPACTLPSQGGEKQPGCSSGLTSLGEGVGIGSAYLLVYIYADGKARAIKVKR